MRRYKSEQDRRHSRGIILWGVHAVDSVIRAGRRPVLDIWAEKGRKGIYPLLELAKTHRCHIEYRTAAELRVRCGSSDHQGIVARVAPYPYLELNTLLCKSNSTNRPTILVLDQLQDPHNLGALIRTGLGTGVGAVVIPRDHAAEVSPTVVRVSAGASEWMPVVRVANIARALDLLRRNEYWIVGLEGSGTMNLYEYSFKGPHVLVLGSEGRGLRRLVREKCDHILRIPLEEVTLDSYNVSVAGALAMGELLRQSKYSA